jgi:tetratricopeptide (TPR) repeat protein
MVMKALEKDRTRRYETASALARDIERHLNDEPVEAGPPSAAYKLKKYALKHRVGLATAGAFAVVLVAATVISSWLAVRAIDAAERERQALNTAQQRLGEIYKANDLLASIFRDLDPDAEEKEGKRLRTILGERLDRAAKQLDSQAIGDPLTVAKLQHILGETQRSLGFDQRAIALATKALRTREQMLGPDHPHSLSSRNVLAIAYRDNGQTAEAIALHEEALKLRTAKLGPEHPDTLISLNNLSSAYLAAGLFARSEPILRQCLAIRERTQPEGWWTFHTRSQLGGSLLGQKQFAQAEPLIVRGYEGLQARQAKIAAPSKKYLAEAAERVVKLYDAWGQPEKAAKWRAQLKTPGEPSPSRARP